jgi:hypothetical protein
MIMKKGIYSAITGMIVVLVVIFGLLIFFGFNKLLFESKTSAETKSKLYSEAKNFKDNLLLCHGHNYLIEDILDEDICDNIFGVDYMVIQELNCEEKTWRKNNNNINENLVYTIGIRQKNSNNICIGKLIISTQTLS